MKVTTLALKYIAFQRYVQFQVNPIPFPSRKENFIINQEYPARSVYFEIVMIMMMMMMMMMMMVVMMMMMMMVVMMVVVVVVVVVVAMSQAFTFWIAAV